MKEKILIYAPHKKLAGFTHAELSAQTHKELQGIIVTKEWTAKDYYSHEDLNRIETIMQYIVDFTKELYPGIEQIDTYVDRSRETIEFAEDLNRVENNLELLGTHVYKPQGWVQTKRDWEPLDRFSYLDANRYEIDVRLLYQYAKSNAEDIIYCGQLRAGEERI